MTNLKIVVADAFTDMVVEKSILAPLRADIVVEHCGPDDDIGALAQDADALIVHWVLITREVIERLTRCRIIARYGVGLENIDVAAARERGICVANVPDYCTDEVASQTLCYLLALGKRVFLSERLMRQGRWEVDDLIGPVRRFQKQTLGLIGLGRIGRRVAQLAAPLGMWIVGYDIQPPKDPGPVTLASFETVVRESDYLSVHCPLLEETRHLINAATFGMMKRTSFLINVARGGVIDTLALIGALTSKQIAGAALDVFEEEPLPLEHPLRKMDNVILTPHTAAYSLDALREIREGVARNVLDHFQHRSV
jgi:D-3-phosphoglycerate dehydrogenase / 2-oxoglutarate reductase